jgi:HK97 family phage portal protein
LSLRSLLGGIVAQSALPVPYVSKWRTNLINMGMPGGNRGRAQQLAQYSEIGTLYGVVSKLASMVSLVNWHLYQSAKSGLEEDRIEVTRHAAKMVWDQPNPFMPRQMYVEIGQQHEELAGEWWWVIARSQLTGGAPIEMWPVRPDRMTPVESNTEFIAGYVYRSPDGEEVPLRREDVIMIRTPAPLDIYRGMSAVVPLEADLDAQETQSAWASSFFRNSAQPGGIVKVDRILQDEEFEQMVTRWEQQHQGITNAGRVAVLEQADFIPLAYTQKDMQFVESRGMTKQAILDAYGFPKFGLGDVDDVNRATAAASLALMAQTLTVPRLERIKGALNNDFLPMFGPTAAGLEFDYDNPVPPDQESDNQTLTAKTGAFKTLIDTGVDADEAADACGLPRMKVTKPEPKVIQVPGAPPGGGPDDGS